MATILFLLDQMMKEYAEGRVRLGEQHEILNGKIVVRKVYNKGFALNWCEDSPRLVERVSLVASVFLIVYYWFCLKRGSAIRKMGMAMQVSGAWSNTYDRLIRGYVIDYFAFQTKNERISKVTFNLGDMFIFVGGLLVTVASVFGKKK